MQISLVKSPHKEGLCCYDSHFTMEARRLRRSQNFIMVTGICRTASELQKWVLFAGGLVQLPLFQGASGRFQHPEIVDRGYKCRYYLIRGRKAGPRGDAACMNSV